MKNKREKTGETMRCLYYPVDGYPCFEDALPDHVFCKRHFKRFKEGTLYKNVNKKAIDLRREGYKKV